jgi:hypothetical protein
VAKAWLARGPVCPQLLLFSFLLSIRGNSSQVCPAFEIPHLVQTDCSGGEDDIQPVSFQGIVRGRHPQNFHFE